jgi:septal ring factor EnvC (AmiA/AmiB activator)
VVRLRKPFRVTLLVGLAAAVATIAFGQTPRNPATMDDLLAELRGLRADLSHVAAANMRMQSLVARLSLQEQRINTLGRQLTDVNAQLEAVTRERIAQEDQLKQFESAVAGGSLPPEMPREDAERELGNQKRQASRTRAREQQLRTQAAEVTASLAAEQDRWTDFNARLDDLERALQSPMSGPQ